MEQYLNASQKFAFKTVATAMLLIFHCFRNVLTAFRRSKCWAMLETVKFKMMDGYVSCSKERRSASPGSRA